MEYKIETSQLIRLCVQRTSEGGRNFLSACSEATYLYEESECLKGKWNWSLLWTHPFPMVFPIGFSSHCTLLLSGANVGRKLLVSGTF